MSSYHCQELLKAGATELHNEVIRSKIISTWEESLTVVQGEGECVNVTGLRVVRR